MPKAPSNKKRRREDEWGEDDYFDGFLQVEDEEPAKEAVYCICHRVSFGEMVACDNPQVSRRKGLGSRE